MITPASLPEPANFVMFASPYGGAPSGTPPVTAADYTATFNGKAIPNWSVGINVSILDTPDANEQSVWVHVLWGHTTGN